MNVNDHRRDRRQVGWQIGLFDDDRRHVFGNREPVRKHLHRRNLVGIGPERIRAAGLAMAIVGGAIMPLIQGRLLDATSRLFLFIVPAVCFAVVTSFAVFDLKAVRHTAGDDETRLDHHARTGSRGLRGRTEGQLLRTDRPARGHVVVGVAVRHQLEVLLNAFKAANPNVDVIDASIEGGAGSNVQVALAARLR